MDCNSNYLFVISFVVGSESGVALVSAPSESDAKRLLMNSGSRNAFPDSYVFTQCRNLGMTVSIRNELLMESYVNALQAYTAICSMIDRMVIGGGSDPDAYHKPETGIPEYDLEGSVQDAIELAKTALQSFTETDPLSVHITQQSLSNAQKAQARSNISAQETLVSGVNIKTINDTSILGEGNIVIEGGGSSQNAVLYVEQALTNAQKEQARANIDAYSKPSSGIPASDIADGVIPESPDFFDAVYNVTSYADIRQAVNNGKTVRLIYDWGHPTKTIISVAPMLYYDEDEICFGFWNGSTDFLSFWISEYGWVADPGIKYQLKINDLNNIRSGAAAGATAYQKPANGIPASDLADGVIPVIMVNDVTLGGSSVLSNGVAVLPAYPTTLPASDVSSWAKQSTKPTYSYSEIQDTPAIPTVESMTAQEVSSAVDAAWNAVMS